MHVTDRVDFMPDLRPRLEVRAAALFSRDAFLARPFSLRDRFPCETVAFLARPSQLSNKTVATSSRLFRPGLQAGAVFPAEPTRESSRREAQQKRLEPGRFEAFSLFLTEPNSTGEPSGAAAIPDVRAPRRAPWVPDEECRTRR